MEFDLLIRGGDVIDGTGVARQRADVGVLDGRIAAIGDLHDSVGQQVIDATQRIVAPGFIDTDMTKVLTEEQKAAMLGQIPLGRLGTPTEIAKVVAFLAGDAGGYITGETIHVNGGMYM